MIHLNDLFDAYDCLCLHNLKTLMVIHMASILPKNQSKPHYIPTPSRQSPYIISEEPTSQSCIGQMGFINDVIIP